MLLDYLPLLQEALDVETRIVIVVDVTADVRDIASAINVIRIPKEITPFDVSSRSEEILIVEFGRGAEVEVNRHAFTANSEVGVFSDLSHNDIEVQYSELVEGQPRQYNSTVSIVYPQRETRAVQLSSRAEEVSVTVSDDGMEIYDPLPPERSSELQVLDRVVEMDERP